MINSLSYPEAKPRVFGGDYRRAMINSLSHPKTKLRLLGVMSINKFLESPQGDMIFGGDKQSN